MKQIIIIPSYLNVIKYMYSISIPIDLKMLNFTINYINQFKHVYMYIYSKLYITIISIYHVHST